jgi:hypothetical protein
VRQVGYSTIVMGGVRDPYILAEIDSWLAQLDDNIKTRIRNTVGCGSRLWDDAGWSPARGTMKVLPPWSTGAPVSGKLASRNLAKSAATSSCRCWRSRRSVAKWADNARMFS